MKHLVTISIIAVGLASVARGRVAQQAAADDIKTPPMPIRAEPDVNAPWTPPQKAGSVYTNDAQLPLEERVRRSRALEMERFRAGAAAPESWKPDREPAPGSMGPRTDLAQLLLLDEPGDGALWAFGGTYKASFDVSGATFVPFFGSHAPRNFPVKFGLREANVAGEPLWIDTAAAPVFDGTTAVFDRGGLRELYDLRVGSMEQLFIFDEVPRTGELVVRMDVASELVALEADGCIEFVGDHGSVRYGRALAFDASGATVDVPTIWTGSGIELRVPVEFIATATMPLTIDPVISTFLVNGDTTAHTILPDIAWDFGNARWLVTYEVEFSGSDHDIFSELRTSDGTLVAASGEYIDFTTRDWRFASCANNRIASQFLVVAERHDSISNTREVWGRTREAEDNTMGAQFQISGNTGDERFPDVGGDPHTSGPTYYCVVYERESTVGADHDILARMVRADSTFLGGSITITNTTAYDRFPSISKSNGVAPATTQEWNIVWQREFTPTDWDIRGAQIHWNGTVVSPSFQVNNSVLNDRNPSASSPLDPLDGARTWMAVYDRIDNDGDRDIFATIHKGATVVNFANLSHLQGGFSQQDQWEPSVDSNGHQFAVAYSERYMTSATDRDVYISTFYLSGDTLHVSENRTNLAFSVDTEFQVEVCARRSGGLLSDWIGCVWRDGPAGLADIEGAVFEVPDFYGPFIGTNYCGPANSNSTGTGAKIRASGSAVAGGQPLNLYAFDMPTTNFGYFLGSPSAGLVSPPASSGVVCVGNPLSRFNGQVQNTGSTGSFDIDVATQAIPTPTGGVHVITAGETWHFQAWYRDGTTNNLSDGVRILFR